MLRILLERKKMLKYSTEWFRGVEQNAEEKEKVIAALADAEAAFKILRKIIARRLESFPSPSQNDYARAAEWSHMQAHRNGRLEELNFLTKLMSPKDREER
jgi:hypothetical protein